MKKTRNMVVVVDEEKVVEAPPFKGNGHVTVTTVALAPTIASLATSSSNRWTTAEGSSARAPRSHNVKTITSRKKWRIQFVWLLRFAWSIRIVSLEPRTNVQSMSNVSRDSGMPEYSKTTKSLSVARMLVATLSLTAVTASSAARFDQLAPEVSTTDDLLLAASPINYVLRRYSPSSSLRSLCSWRNHAFYDSAI